MFGPDQQSPKEGDGTLDPEIEKSGGFAHTSLTNLAALDTDTAFSKRAKIVQSIADRLERAGLNIRQAGGQEFGMVLAMSMNALMPEYAGSFLPERQTRLEFDTSNNRVLKDPPDIRLQQEIVRYFRNDPRLHPELADCMALTCRVASPYAPIEKPAVQVNYLGSSNSSGSFTIGNRRFDLIDDSTGAIYIPGCGISGLLECSKFLESLGEKSCPNLRFILCDNHPFVAEVGSRFARYLDDPRIQFIPRSMEEVAIPADTTHILLSFVEAAGSGALERVASQAAALPKVKVLAISGRDPNEYSKLSSSDVVQLFNDSGTPLTWRETVKSYSTHIVRDGQSIDFCDLSAEEAEHLIMSELSGGPPPNSSSEILSNCPPD